MGKLDVSAVLGALRKVVPAEAGRVALHEPAFHGHEWDYVRECLDTGWVSSVGKYVDLFEVKLAEFTGAKRAIAVVNGTAALHLCLKLVGVEHGDEVLVPSLTFVATANAVSYCGAVPHFVECTEATLGADPEKLREYLKRETEVRSGACLNKKTGKRIRAFIAMHSFGHALDLDALVKVCSDFHIELVEDAAESLGTLYKGRHTGNLGKTSALSFNGNKIITTGGGGAILTNDEKLGTFAKHLSTTAKQPHAWEYFHDHVGYNYRLPNLNAALGCAQMEELPKFLVQKRELATRYQAAFEGVAGASIFKEPEFSRSNYWLNVMLLDEKNAGSRDALLERLNAEGLGSRPSWMPMHKLPMYAKCPRMDLAVTESLERRLINLPSSAKLAGAQKGDA